MNDNTQNSPADSRAEFPILDRMIYLNHAGVAPIPARGAEAIRRYADDLANLGATPMPRWIEETQRTRRAAAELIGTRPHEVAFVQNTTHGLLCVANSLPWRAGDNVVTAEGEFPANVQPWRNLEQLGVARRVVPERPDRTFSVDDFRERIDARTRLVAVSLVQYATGYRMPVESLAELCRERGAWLCLDAIQAVGAMPVNVEALGCDFLSADGHKWMLGPEGCGIFYVRRELLDVVNDSMVGWLGRERPLEFDNHEQAAAPSARRFEPGSLNVAGVLALGESLRLFHEVGPAAVWSRIEALTAHVRQAAAREALDVVSPAGDGERSGIVCLRWEGIDEKAVAARLADRDIIVSPRRGSVRLSPHFYNTTEQLDTTLAALIEARDA